MRLQPRHLIAEDAGGVGRGDTGAEGIDAPPVVHVDEVEGVGTDGLQQFVQATEEAVLPLQPFHRRHVVREEQLALGAGGAEGVDKDYDPVRGGRPGRVAMVVSPASSD